MTINVQPVDQASGQGCACCGGEGGVRGFIFDDDEPHAVYFAESGGMANKPVVLIGVVTGRWGADATMDERVSMVFACSKGDRALEAQPTIPYLLAFPEFKLLDAGVDPEAAAEHPDYPHQRALIDAIVAQDSRFAHLRSGAQARAGRFVADAPD